MTTEATDKTKLTDAQCVYELSVIVDELRTLNDVYGPNISTSRSISRCLSLIEHFGVTLIRENAKECEES